MWGSPAGFKFAIKIRIQARHSSQDLTAGHPREVEDYLQELSILGLCCKRFGTIVIFMDMLATELDFFYGQDDHDQEKEKGGRRSFIIKVSMTGTDQKKKKWKASFTKKYA